MPRGGVPCKSDQERLQLLRENQCRKAKKWRQNHPEQVRELARKAHAKKVRESPELARQQAAGKARKARASLTDSYLKTKIVQGTCLKFSDVPAELVELKRALLLLKRSVKGQLQHEEAPQ